MQLINGERSIRPSRKAQLSTRLRLLPLGIAIGSLAVLLPWIALIPSMLDALLAGLALGLVTCTIGFSVCGLFRPMLGVSSTWAACWMCIPAIYQLAHGEAAWGDGAVLKSGNNVTLALGLNVITQVALLIGYFGRVRSRYRSRGVHDVQDLHRLNDCQPMAVRAGLPNELTGQSMNIFQSNMRGRYLETISQILIVLSVSMLPYVAKMKGGLQVLFQTRDLQKAAADPALDVAVNGGVQAAIVEFLPFAFSVAGTLLLIAELHRVGWRRLALASRFALFVGVAMTWCYANPMANTRFVSLAMLGSLALASAWPRSGRAGTGILGAFIVLVLVVYPFAGVFSSSSGLSDTDTLAARGGFGSFATQDFDGFQQTINSFEYVEHNGHSWGRYLISALFVFVPRSIWSGKATPASIDVAANHGYVFTNLSLATNAEIYIDFGWVGVAVLFVLVGRTFAFMDRAWQSELQWQPIIAFSTLAQIGISRGPLGSQIPVVIFTVGVLVLAKVIIRSHPSGTRERRKPCSQEAGV